MAHPHGMLITLTPSTQRGRANRQSGTAAVTFASIKFEVLLLTSHGPFAPDTPFSRKNVKETRQGIRFLNRYSSQLKLRRQHEGVISSWPHATAMKVTQSHVFKVNLNYTWYTTIHLTYIFF